MTSADMVDLADPVRMDIAQQIVCSAENSSLNWRAQYGYIEDIDDGRGYTGGLVGYCSGTGDMLEVVERYVQAAPSAPLARFLPALRMVNGSDSHAGLGRAFESAWRAAAEDPAFRRAQHDVRGGIRRTAMRVHGPPSAGGGEATYLAAFLDAGRRVMRREEAHADTSRIDTAQARWLAAGNLDLEPPLRWQVYGDSYEIG